MKRDFLLQEDSLAVERRWYVIAAGLHFEAAAFQELSPLLEECLNLLGARAVPLAGLETEHRYGRRFWGFLFLEVWQRQFHDQAATFRGVLDEKENVLA